MDMLGVAYQTNVFWEGLIWAGPQVQGKGMMEQCGKD
jgi:hypothetical protein